MTRTPSVDTRNAQRCDAPTSGSLVLIGGALDEDPGILQRIVALAAGAETPSVAPRIAIFTTASEPATSAADAASTTAENDEADGRYYVELFARHGAIGVPIPVGAAPEPPFAGASYHRGMAEDAQIAETVRSCDGVFLGGGDQTHYVLALFRSDDPTQPPFVQRHDTPVMAAIRDLHRRGGVIAGTSAGLAVQQAAPMVSGGTSREGWLHGASAGYEDDDALRYIPAGGIGVFPEGLLDSHFNEWGRVTRAIRLAHDTQERLAIGVDEHTALVYSPGHRTGAVIGTGGVSILDLAEAEFANGASGPGVLGVRWTHLTAGDRFDFERGETTRASATHVAPGTGTAPAPAHDVWGEDRGTALLHLAQQLLASPDRHAAGDTTTDSDATASNDTDSPTNSTPDHGSRFRVTLDRDERTTWTDPGGFADLRLSITPLSSAA